MGVVTHMFVMTMVSELVVRFIRTLMVCSTRAHTVSLPLPLMELRHLIGLYTQNVAALLLAQIARLLLRRPPLLQRQPRQLRLQHLPRIIATVA